MRRLPSLNGLRAFEAAARHGSFVGASQELNVTQAAISRMVRLLEARLGIELFERLPNGLVLTAQAEALKPRSHGGLQFDRCQRRASRGDADHADFDDWRRTLLCDALDDPAPCELLRHASRHRGAARDRRRDQSLQG